MAGSEYRRAGGSGSCYKLATIYLLHGKLVYSPWQYNLLAHVLTRELTHRTSGQQLSAVFLRAKILTEKRNHMILDTFCHLTCVRALVHFKAVCDSIRIKNIVQLAGVDM